MDHRLKRRTFVRRIMAAAVSTAFLGGCLQRRDGKTGSYPDLPEPDADAQISSAKSTFSAALNENRKLPRDLVMQLLDQKVDQYMHISHHCAQSSFLAINEHFELGGTEIVKALTPLTGVAERGETCGAVTGPLLALGLIYGRNENQLRDWDTYRESLIPAGRFCSLFEKEYGSTMCRDIQQAEFGRCFRLTDPGELQEFQESDATRHCSAVVRKAVRIAANIILDDNKNRDN